MNGRILRSPSSWARVLTIAREGGPVRLRIDAV